VSAAGDIRDWEKAALRRAIERRFGASVMPYAFRVVTDRGADGRVLRERAASTPTFFAPDRPMTFSPPEDETALELERLGGPLSRVLAALRRMVEPEART